MIGLVAAKMRLNIYTDKKENAGRVFNCQFPNAIFGSIVRLQINHFN